MTEYESNTAQARCPVCGAWGTDLARVYGSYRLRECGSCRLQYAKPLVGPGPNWYQEDAETQIRLMLAWRRKPSQMLREPHRRFLRAPVRSGGSLLDVGCADGAFLACASKYYSGVCGLDFNKNAIDVAREHYGIEHVFPVTLQEFRESRQELGVPAAFDVITCFDVIEHVHDPVSLLLDMRSLLTSAGVLVVNTPNRDRVPNLREPFDLPPHHLTRWTTESLERALIRAGFSTYNVESFTGNGYLSSALMDAILPVGRLKRELALRASCGSLRATSQITNLLSRSRSVVAALLDLPLLAALRLTGAPGQMLYATATAPSADPTLPTDTV